MRLLRILAFSSLCVLFASAAFADSIPVNNPSFETLPSGAPPLGGSYNCGAPGSNCSYEVGQVPGWTVGGQAGLYQPGTSGTFNSLPAGPTVAFVNGGASIFQTLGVDVQPDTTYTLQLDLGERTDANFAALAYLAIGGQEYQATGTAPSPGDWSIFTATFTCDSSCGQVGDPIQILLSSSGLQGDFDNVQMFSTSVPEPATISMLLLGLIGLAAFGWRRKRSGLAAS